MPQELIMRGQTDSGETETLNFSGYKPGYAYKMTEFTLYPGSGASTTGHELLGSVTAGKNAVDPAAPNFDDEGLIATAYAVLRSDAHGNGIHSVIDDTFLITQNLILKVQDVFSAGSPIAVNWQCKFEKVKLSDSAQAVANYNQSTIYE